MKRLISLATLLGAIGLVASVPAEAPGCGMAPRENERIAVASESAFIIWDEAAKMEHFIRRATFEGTSYDFGFLVPTPARPQLEEADSALFPELTRLTAAKVVHETREVREEIDFGCAHSASKMAAGEATPSGKSVAPGGFAVLEQRRVGELDAAVLGFRDGEGDPKAAAKDLLEWLNKNGYAVRPDLLDWITIYARDKWVITAFKIAGVPPQGMGPNLGLGVGPKDDPDQPTAPPIAKKDDARPRRSITLSSTAVRMSFPATRPFYPYREPAAQRAEANVGGPRLLRVFVAAKQRVAGKFGNGSTAWPGQTVWADALPGELRGVMLARARLRQDVAPGDWKITEFEDHSSPRPGTDEVYFEPSADQSAVARPPHVIVDTIRVRVYPDWFAPVAIAGPFVLLIGGLLLVRLLRK